MIYINGTIVKGESSASGQKMNWDGYGSIHHQVNFFKNHYPSFGIKLVKCKMATINVKLLNPFIPTSWEYNFDKVFWLPNSDTWFEKIAFIPIIFIFKNEQVEAWIYKAYKSPHKNDNCLLEVIAPNIKNLNNNDICKITIQKKYIE